MAKKLDTKRIPLEAMAILKNSTEDELIFMSELSASLKFDTFINITRHLIDNNMEMVFSYPETEPQKLAVFKANARGQVGALTLLIYVIKGASREIERRRKK